MSEVPPSDIIEVEIDLSEMAPESPPLAELPLALDEPATPAAAAFAATPAPPLQPAPLPSAPQPPALLTVPASPAPWPSAPQTPTAPALPAPFDEIVSRVADKDLRALAASTLGRILKALEALRAIEDALTSQKVITVGALFDGLRAQATSLLSFLTEAAVRGDLDEGFREVLDGVRFVMAHEVGKVYSYEFPALTAEGPSAYSRAELTRAWGLLHNCLQQTAITLARTIDSSATGQRLFEDYRRKTENSLTLYSELNALLQKVKTAEKANGILLKHTLVRHLEHFREETMHFLMYKDWGEFGRYVDEVKRAFEEMEEFDCVLHGFAQYLTTLIHHVGMREVLRARHTPRAATRGARGPQPA